MKTLVLDESLDISPSIHNFLAARGAEGIFVCSAQELELAEASQGPVELRVINLSPAVTAWEVSRHLKGAAGTTLVFHDGSAAGLEHLAGLPGVRCLERPRAAAELVALLERAFGRPEGGARTTTPAAAQASAVVSDIIGQSPADPRRLRQDREGRGGQRQRLHRRRERHRQGAHRARHPLQQRPARPAAHHPRLHRHPRGAHGEPPLRARARLLHRGRREP